MINSNKVFTCWYRHIQENYRQERGKMRANICDIDGIDKEKKEPFSQNGCRSKTSIFALEDKEHSDSDSSLINSSSSNKYLSPFTRLISLVSGGKRLPTCFTCHGDIQ